MKTIILIATIMLAPNIDRKHVDSAASVIVKSADDAIPAAPAAAECVIDGPRVVLAAGGSKISGEQWPDKRPKSGWG